MLRRPAFLANILLCCGVTGSAMPALGQAASGSAQIVEDARGDYYNLAREGLKEFRCGVMMEWPVATVPANADTRDRDKLVAAMGQMHLVATVGTHGAPRVEFQFGGTVRNDDLAQNVRAASAAAQKSLSGALDEFSSLLFGSPFPPDRDYHVEDQGDTLRITFGSDEVRIIETMNKNHAIEEIIIATQHSTVTVRPGYKRIEKAFVPAAIDSKVEAAGADPVELHVDIAYQAVDGFELPQTVTVRDKQLSAGEQVPFKFSGCQVTR